MSYNTVDITQNKTQERHKQNKPRSPHRHSEPSYDKPAHRFVFAKRLRAAWDAHDLNRNPHIIKLRREGGRICTRTYNDGSKRFRILPPRRLTMRRERHETLNELVKAVINNVDYSDNAQYPLECRLSLEALAEQIGQLHRYERGYSEHYPHGRVSYDPLHGALDDLRASGLFLVVTGYDRDAAKFKASRIFLTPRFLDCLGFTGAEVNKLIKCHAHWRKLNPSAKVYEPPPVSAKMAEVSTKTLLNLLDYHGRWFAGECEPDAIAESQKQLLEEERQKQRKGSMSTAAEALERLNKPEKRESELEQISRRYNKLKEELNAQPIHCKLKEQELKKSYPVYCIEYYESLIAWLTNSIN